MDTYKEIQAEERAYSEWERAEKNRILKITNYIKRQDAWNKLFPKMVRSDSWMFTGNIF